jgi:hypothetical protein
VQGDVATRSVQLATDAGVMLQSRAHDNGSLGYDSVPEANIPGIVAYLQVWGCMRLLLLLVLRRAYQP